VAFAILGVGAVVGGLFYFYRRSQLESNKYVTLADKLNTTSSRPPSPTHMDTIGSSSSPASNANGARFNGAFEISSPNVHETAAAAATTDNNNNFKVNFDEFQFQERDRVSESSL
jgi:hypothetical protein